MDHMKTFDLISPFPQIEYFVEGKDDDEYCSKFKVTFFLAEEGISKVIEVIAPMLLIATLNTMHVLNNDADAGATDYIANSATLALTAVFLLPNIKGESNRTEWLTFNNLYIFLIFIGLALSSFPQDMVGTNVYALVGNGFLWGSFLIPLLNTLKFLRHENIFWGGKDLLGEFLQKEGKKKNKWHESVKVTELADDEEKREEGGYKLNQKGNIIFYG